MEWSAECRKHRKKNKQELNLQLNKLLNEEPDDDNLIEWTEVKLAPNMEADKEEIY